MLNSPAKVLRICQAPKTRTIFRTDARSPRIVMPGRSAGHPRISIKNVDGRDKPGHDGVIAQGLTPDLAVAYPLKCGRVASRAAEIRRRCGRHFRTWSRGLRAYARPS